MLYTRDANIYSSIFLLDHWKLREIYHCSTIMDSLQPVLIGDTFLCTTGLVIVTQDAIGESRFHLPVKFRIRVFNGQRDEGSASANDSPRKL